VLAGLLVLLVLMLVPRKAVDEDESFAPWASDEAADDPAGDEPVMPRADYRPARPEDSSDIEAKARPPRRPVFEDALNRPGPDPSSTQRHEGASKTGDPPEAADSGPSGTLDKATIQEGIKTLRPILRVCYEGLLEEFPSAAGKVTLSFRIAAENEEGRVELSELDSEKTTLFDEKLHDCMMESIGDAKFPAPEGGGVVSVTYPFVFVSDEEPEVGDE